MYKLMKFEIMFFQDWLVSWSSLIGMHFNPVDSKQMFNIKFAMTGFKPRVFGVGIDCSANWATTTTQFIFFLRIIQFLIEKLAVRRNNCFLTDPDNGIVQECYLKNQ